MLDLNTAFLSCPPSTHFLSPSFFQNTLDQQKRLQNPARDNPAGTDLHSTCQVLAELLSFAFLLISTPSCNFWACHILQNPASVCNQQAGTLLLDPGTPKTFSPRPGPCLNCETWSVSPAPPFPTRPVFLRIWHPDPPFQDKPAWTPLLLLQSYPLQTEAPSREQPALQRHVGVPKAQGATKGTGRAQRTPFQGRPLQLFFFLPFTRQSHLASHTLLLFPCTFPQFQQFPGRPVLASLLQPLLFANLAQQATC